MNLSVNQLILAGRLPGLTLAAGEGREERPGVSRLKDRGVVGEKKTAKSAAGGAFTPPKPLPGPHRSRSSLRPEKHGDG